MTVNSLARVEETVQTCQAMRNVRAARRAVPCHIWERLVAGKETRWGCQELWRQSSFCRGTCEDRVGLGKLNLGERASRSHC